MLFDFSMRHITAGEAPEAAAAFEICRALLDIGANSGWVDDIGKYVTRPTSYGSRDDRAKHTYGDYD